MARIKRNIGEQVSGKIGNVVFVQTKNGSYVRAAPVRKNDYWTEAQLMARDRVSAMARLWRAIQSGLMTKIWNNTTDKMNGYAWFMKQNMKNLSIAGELTDPALFIVADGPLAPLQLLKAERQAPLSEVIRVSWQNDPHIKAARLRY